MAINRLTRDQILIRALDLADSAALDNKDRPAGTIVAGALSIGWLQEALDYFHKRFPFSADILAANISVAEGGTTIAVPSDFILDYNNGIVLNDDSGNSMGRSGRLIRRGLGAVINYPASSGGGQPSIYAVRGSTIETRPKANKSYTGKLYYYALPTALAAATVPIFPDDFILVEYVHLKAREWHRAIPAGSALEYANARIGELQRAGIGPEAEEDQIGIGTEYVGAVPNDWLAWK